ncbi:MAG: class I SAM-dependent methyltransferase [Candidatus Binatia bacterium]
MLKSVLRWLRPAAPPASEEIDCRTVGLGDMVKNGWFVNATGEMAPGFRVGKDDVLVDVGCGEGGATRFAARQGAKVIFSDVDADKVAALDAALRESGVMDATGLVGDSNPLAIADGVASRVVCSEVLEHVDEPAVVLAELVRVGKPDAVYLLTVPDPTGERLQRRFASANYFAKPNHIRIFEREQFAALVREAGLEILDVRFMGAYWTLWMCFYWALERESGREPEGAILDRIVPPFHPLLQSWARTWQYLTEMPEAAPVRRALDEFIPKSQVIIARKP